jgi:3-hydroxy-9,10-secoandrosta-1,3,5(10)-triene-9,17-dione monooxygenase reductase component
MPVSVVPSETHHAVVNGSAMRDVLGHFASGVVVVTAWSAGGAGPVGPVGFTCQSFASLSLDPPLVTFAPARTSSTWPLIRTASTFCVNVLAADQQELSAGFARRGTDRFAGVAWRLNRFGAPELDGACAWISCRPARYAVTVPAWMAVRAIV